MAKSDVTKLGLLFAIVALSGLPLGLAVINTVSFFLAQAALIILMIRYRYIYAALPGLVAMALCAAIYGFQASIYFFFLALLPGLLMGIKARTFSTPRSIITWGFAPYMVTVLIAILFYSEIGSQTELISEEFQVVMRESAATMGVSGAEMDQALELFNKMLYWFIRLLPGILFTLFLALVMFVYLGATSVSRYFGAVIPSMSPPYFWKIGEIWLVPFAVSMALVLLGGEGMKIIGENLLVFFVHFYALFGICVIDFYLNQLNIPSPVRMLIYIILLLPGITMLLLALVGLADSRFDFRKLAFESES